MASLNSICELSWKQCFPTPDDETPITKEEFIESGILEYAYQMQLMYYKEKKDEGYFEMSSYLLTEVELDVKNDEIDISCLNVFRSFSSDIWLQSVGGFGCDCKYIKSTVNLSQLLCDEESRGHGDKTYVPLGNKIKFPQGVHKSPLTIIYANKGEGVDGDMEVDEVIGNVVRDRLVEKYLGKIQQEDVTNNSNPNI